MPVHGSADNRGSVERFALGVEALESSARLDQRALLLDRFRASTERRKRTRDHYDVVVIGAGPAGLAAGALLSRVGDVRFLVVEQGNLARERDRSSPVEITHGVGGAGLFSDGKFSFFPAATHLWTLPHKSALADAYARSSRVMESFGLTVPALPGTDDVRTLSRRHPGALSIKEYSSQYLHLAHRMSLIHSLSAPIARRLWTNTKLRSLRFEPEHDRFRLVLQRERSSRVITSAAVIMACGRFQHLQFPILPQRFLRLECGVRLEDVSDNPFWRELQGNDPKILLREGADEWRTFCCVRDGEVVPTCFQRRWTCSGRRDGARTGRSNIGFNVRLKAPMRLPFLGDALGRGALFELPLEDALEDPSHLAELRAVFGEVLPHLLRGLELLAEHFPLVRRARMLGPTLEGIGYYPDLDPELRSPGRPLWVAGDGGGRFRGLVAGLTSGYYCAGRALAFLGRTESNHHGKRRNLG